MANSFQQQALQRRVIYLGLILALFTASLMHRKFIVEKQAENLQLRDAARGEVELTSSFVRLSLTGSRGLATTILWATAMDRMTKHEWNELELLVNSISTLQPYFVTPWLFQSWNLAFNVAVECDRPHDKFYYVSRGLELLAEGERRNQGTAEEAKRFPPGTMPSFPGNPEMRHFVGFYYQLKIGNSDEKNTMRCLLDLSCIDPLKRDPERFKGANKREALKKFCEDNPRLVRRLREQLGYTEPKQIVEFLDANKDVPTRFKKAVARDQQQSELEIARKQFPILPPVAPRPARPDTGPRWPDPDAYELTTESIDVFLVCRTWYQYAQESLPPPERDPLVTEKEKQYAEKIDRLRKEQQLNFRDSKTMASQIFRGYPARGQYYIAETLEAEGWFGDQATPTKLPQNLRDEISGGWLIKGWFDQGGDEQPLRVGTGTKYYARPAWEEAYRMYLLYGTQNGMYLSPAELAELEHKAQAVRAMLKIGPYDMPPPLRADKRPLIGESYDAQQKLIGRDRARSLTNYDAHLYQTEAEQDPETVLARSLLHHALRYNIKDEQEALPLYKQAWPLWIEVALRYPNFMEVMYVPDDIYEAQLKYLRLSQLKSPKLFRELMLGMAQSAVWPHPNWEKMKWINPGQMAKIVTVRVARGPLEMVAYYKGPEARAVRDYWFAMTYAASRIGQLGFAPPVPMPDQANYALAGSIWERRETPPPGLRYLIDPTVVTSVRQRVGLIRPPENAAALPVK